MNKIQYLLRSFKNIFKDNSCPFCANDTFTIVQKKYLLTRLVRCNKCHLQYRTPKDEPKFLKKFYQTDYKVDVQMMTTLPELSQLAILKKNCFKELRDYFPLINIFTQKENKKVIDYGCSWGYNVFKLNSKGLDVQGFELSIPRAKYGAENLDIDLVYKEDEIRHNNNVFYSSHVIEHLSDIKSFIDKIKSVLVVDGVAITLCPNGSEEFKKRNPTLFSYTWGQLHPNYIDINFMQYAFSKHPYYITTGDDVFNLEKIKSWDGRTQFVDEIRDGFELLVIVKPNILI